MSLQILGINHTTAPVALRERVAIPRHRLPHAYGSLRSVPGVEAGVIVSTCNRVELYCETGFEAARPLAAWLAGYHGVALTELEAHLYHYRHSEAIRHILRVASGLDSMVLGEPQVLGQLKSAYQTAAAHHDLGLHLERLFQHSFAVAKQVRSQTRIGASPVSVAYAAVTLAEQIFADLREQTALLIGAGETMELAARHLRARKLGRMVIANRSHARAYRLARQFGALAIELPDIGAHLRDADIVLCSTAGEQPVVTLPLARQASAKRRRPILMIDIAVPRDIEPAVQSLEDVYLYNIDDMRGIIEQNMQSRAAAAAEARQMVEAHTRRFVDWARARDAVPTIRAIHDWAAAARAQSVAKAEKQLAQGKPATEVLEGLARNLTRKLIHRPCAALREAAARRDIETIESARRLFDLERPDEGA